MSVENTCSICMESMSGECHTLQDCGHRFHCVCIINWFRQASTCPMCRNDGPQNLPRLCLHERAKMMKRVARRKDAPTDLKKLVERAKKARVSFRACSSALTAYNRGNRSVIHQMRSLRSKRLIASMQLRRTEALLGAYNCSQFPLPPLIVHQFL